MTPKEERLAKALRELVEVVEDFNFGEVDKSELGWYAAGLALRQKLEQAKAVLILDVDLEERKGET